MTFLLQSAPQQLGHPLFVFDDQDLHLPDRNRRIVAGKTEQTLNPQRILRMKWSTG